MLVGLRANLASSRHLTVVRRHRHFELQLLDPTPPLGVRSPSAPEFQHLHHSVLRALGLATLSATLLVFAPTRVSRYRRFLQGQTTKEAWDDPTGLYAKWADAQVDPSAWLPEAPSEVEPRSLALSSDQLADWRAWWWALHPNSGVVLLFETADHAALAATLFAEAFDPQGVGGETGKRMGAALTYGKRRTARSGRVVLFLDEHLRVSLIGAATVIAGLYQTATATCRLSGRLWPVYVPSGAS